MNFKEHLKNYVENNPALVAKKQASDDIFVLKYKRKVFFKNLWNRYTEVCRGTLVDRDYNVISLPFTKIYNFGIENNAPNITDDEIVSVYRKVNGFMGAATWHHEAPLLSTTGSINSDFVGYFRDMIDDWDAFCETLKDNPTKTFMFEVVHPEDPHIVPEDAGVYLLAFRKKEWDSVVEHDPGELYAHSTRMQVRVPEFRQMNMGLLRRVVREVRHEGFVVYCDDGRATKIKSPYYLVNKFMARIKDPMRLLDNNVFDRIDEEYYPLVYLVRDNIEDFKEMDEQGRLAWIKERLEEM